MESLLFQYHVPPLLLFRSTQHQQLSILPSKRRRRRINCCWLRMNFKSKDARGLFATVASSISSFPDGSSASDYSEQFSGPKLKKRMQKIAGIDQDELLDPKHLADPDSCFCEFNGIDIHYKVCEAELEAPSSLQEHSFSPLGPERKMIDLSMILLHGFGASVFSWNKVMKPLACIIGSKVLAFDRPAFGLTSRVSYQGQINGSDAKSSNPYSTLFSVLTTLYFVDLLGSDKAVIVGHSAGAVTAVRSYFEAPDRVAALILVAPAIFAPISAPKVIEGDHLPNTTQSQQNAFSSERSPSVTLMLAQILSMLSRGILSAMKMIFSAMKMIFSAIKDMAISLYKTIVSSILRSSIAVFLVRFIINYFGIAAVRKAWYDGRKVTDHVIHGYTKPLKANGWDRALIEYIVALLADSGDESKPSQSRGVHEISCPGDTDRLVPAWNAERLSRTIPGSHLEVIKNCGHLPHEEKPEEFLLVVQRFLENVVASPKLPVAVPT